MCEDGDIIGLMAIKRESIKCQNTFRFFVATYGVEGVVFLMKDNFANPPWYLDVWLVR